MRAGAAVLCIAVALGASGCSDDDDQPGGPPSGDAVEEACDALAAVAQAVRGVRDAQTLDEVRTGVEPALDELVEAAEALGDQELRGYAVEARDRFEVYLTADDPLDSRAAGNDADVAMDRAARRCTELGASTVFPEEPGPSG